MPNRMFRATDSETPFKTTPLEMSRMRAPTKSQHYNSLLILYQVFQNEDDKITPDADTKHYGSIEKAAVDVTHDTVVSNVDFGKLDHAHTQEKEKYQPGNAVFLSVLRKIN